MAYGTVGTVVRKTPIRKTIVSTSILIVVLGILIWSAYAVELSPLGLIQDSGNIITYLKDYFPPEFSRFELYAEQTVLTIQMAVWGTLLAIIPGIPLAVLASRNFSPNMVVYQVARRVLDLLRSVNEMVFALIFVVAVGLGPFPGVLALAVHTTGVFGKLLAEAIESIDPGPVEAVRSAGANPVQVFVYAIWPQILPHTISYSLLRFETNVRSATVVGLTGAGGIGFYLWDAMRSFDYRDTATMLIMITVVVMLIDYGSARIRARII